MDKGDVCLRMVFSPKPKIICELWNGGTKIKMVTCIPHVLLFSRRKQVTFLFWGVTIAVDVVVS